MTLVLGAVVLEELETISLLRAGIEVGARFRRQHPFVSQIAVVHPVELIK